MTVNCLRGRGFRSAILWRKKTPFSVLTPRLILSGNNITYKIPCIGLRDLFKNFLVLYGFVEFYGI